MRLLLDGLFDDAEDLRSNQATVEYLATVAAAEGLDLAAVSANPAGGGKHAKWLIVRVDNMTWAAVGSLYGGAIRYKVNREVVLMVDQAVIYARLIEVLLHEWALVIRKGQLPYPYTSIFLKCPQCLQGSLLGLS